MLSRLRESWIVPAALLVLAVGVVAWLLVPLVWGGEDSAEEPVSSQPEFAQQPEEPPQPGPEDPGVESRNVASYAAFESKDPFGSRAGLAEDPEEADPEDAPEAEQDGTEPGGEPEESGDPAAQREREAREDAPDRQDPSEAGPGDDDFSVLEAAEGEREGPQEGEGEREGPREGPAADREPGTGGVGGDGPVDRQEAFQNGDGPRGPSK